jgi:4-amino-4-deoxy-L-arabinose transferase-like glycosyltransferase
MQEDGPVRTRLSFAIVGLGLLAIFLGWFATRWGIGMSPDAVSYVGSAKTFLAGDGLRFLARGGELQPLVVVPPLFPLVIATVAAAGVDAFEAARWINILLFGINTSFVGYLVARSCPRTFWLPVLASFLMATGVPMLYVHTAAWSEPLYLFFCLIAVLGLTNWHDMDSRPWLFVASVAISLGFLTRYVGVSLVAFGVVALLIKREKRWFDYALCLVLPFATVVRNILFGSGGAVGTGRTPNVPQSEALAPGVRTLSSWIAPVDNTGLQVLLALLVVALLVSAFVVNRPAAIGSWLPRLAFTYAGAYLLVMSQAGGSLDDRGLSSLFVFGLVGTIPMFHALRRSKVVMRWASVASILLVLFAASYAVRAGEWVVFARANGRYYEGPAFRRSPTVAYIDDLPADVVVYTNQQQATYFLTGRRVRGIPPYSDPAYARDMESIERRADEKTVVVYFTNLTGGGWVTSMAQVRERWSLHPVERTEDGLIFEFVSPRE